MTQFGFCDVDDCHARLDKEGDLLVKISETWYLSGLDHEVPNAQIRTYLGSHVHQCMPALLRFRPHTPRT